MDVYRLDSLAEFFSAGLEEYFYRRSVVVMEWADRWPEVLPEQRIRVAFQIIDEHRRKITFSGDHPRAVKIIESLSRNKGFQP